jgi:predicted acetyltransferase
MSNEPTTLRTGTATLIEPTVDVQSSYLQAMAEFASDNRTGRESALMRQIEEWGGIWDTADGFAAFVAALTRAGDPAVPCPDEWVHSSTYWLVDTVVEGPTFGSDGFTAESGVARDRATFIGEVRVRHELNAHLLDAAGHIGYDIAPSARQRGHGRRILALALQKAAQLGITDALLVCDRGNVASRRIIEANGGVFEDERSGHLRFWVATATDRGSA